MPRTKCLLIERTAAITGGDKATGHQQTDLSTNGQSGKRVERGNKWFNFVESTWKPKLVRVFWLKRAWAASEITHSKIKQTKPCTEVRKVATLGSGSDQKAAPGGLCGPGNVMFLDNGDYTGMFSFKKFISLYTYDICTFLYVYYTSI